MVKLRLENRPDAMPVARGRHLEEPQMRPQRTTLLKPCAQCGVEFTPYPRRSGMFCSRVCYMAAHERPARTCEQCGIVFVLPSKKRPGRFCSRACLSVAVRIGPAEFWARVNRSGPIPACRPDLGPCWLWTASLQSQGYGMASLLGEPTLAHRAAWKLSGRSFTPGLVLDHLCRVRSCVRPDHLEEVTEAENIRRGVGRSALHATKTHCIRGHSDWRIKLNGWRECRTCRRLGRPKR